MGGGEYLRGMKLFGNYENAKNMFLRGFGKTLKIFNLRGRRNDGDLQKIERYHRGPRTFRTFGKRDKKGV